MKFLCVILIVLSISYPAFSQESVQNNSNLEISFGSSLMIYQSVMSLQSRTVFEGVLRFPIKGAFFAQAGARTSIDPAYMEGFARILITDKIHSWQPFLGIEFGITKLDQFTSSKKLLSETKAAMDGDISPFYIACQSAPLSFSLWEKWRLSVMEIHIGTHLDHFGRTLRLQVGVISIGRML